MAGPFGALNEQTYSVLVGDPGADDKRVPFMRAPVDMEVLSARIIVQNDQGTGSATTFRLENWGTAGTAVAGTVIADLGGTHADDRLSAETPAAGSVVEGTVLEGEYLYLDTQLTGAWVEQQVWYEILYVEGTQAA